jgi:hypothetical protein
VSTEDIDVTPEQVHAYARAQAAKIPPDFGKGWMTKSARDLLRIAAIADFDTKELCLRLAKVKPRGENINARTVERIMAEMAKEQTIR